MPIETELKFLATPDGIAALAAHPDLAGEERVAQLRSVYFDTPDRDLWRRGMGLRVRATGKGFVQTVKLQDGEGAYQRGEWETPVEAERVDLDALAGTPAAEALDGRAQDLEPVFTTAFERRARLCRRGGAVIEAALDQGEILAGALKAPICELELELKEGDPSALFALAGSLTRDVGAGLSFEGKAERGYRLAAGTGLDPRRAAAAALWPDMPAAAAFQSIARACLAQVCANAELFAIVQRPEALHQIRVGLRRLRAALAAFKPMLVDDALEGVVAELAWLAGELDLARDLDVFIHGAFQPAAAALDDPDFAPLGRRLLEAQTDAYERALRAVGSRRCAVMAVRALAWIETGPWTTPSDAVLADLRARPIGAFAREALDHLRKVVRRRGRDLAGLDPVSRHKLRIRAKRLRYAAELLDPLYAGAGKRRTRFIAALKRLQDRLGELNDIAVARERIRREARLNGPRLALAAGRIIGRRERDEPALLDAAAEAFEAFRAAKPYWR